MGEDKMPVLTDEHEATSLKNEFVDEPLPSSSVRPQQSVQVVVSNPISPRKRRSSPCDEETRERGSKRRRASGTHPRFTVHEHDLR